MSNKARGKGKLTEEQKAFVVQRLACWDTPSEASAALLEHHKVELTAQGCEAYDPNKRAGRNLAQKWRELFRQTRTAFLEHLEDHIPHANKAVRIRKLAKAADSFEVRGNYIAMADMLERIAKEQGNVHTNKREVTGKDGKPMQVEYTDMTDDQVNTRILQLLGDAIGGASHERTGD